MWIMSEDGFLHSGRIVAIRPPIDKEDDTIRVTLDVLGERDIRVLREDAFALLNMPDETIKEKSRALVAALAKDNARRESEALRDKASLLKSQMVEKPPIGLRLVKFHADWCEPCKEMEEFLAPVETPIDRVDIDKEPDRALFAKIIAVPTIIAYVGPKEVSRHIGFDDPGKLVDWLKSLDE
jgi:thiol-disulfide isomerase/thioredoxin